MLNVRVVGDLLEVKWLFTWLSLNSDVFGGVLFCAVLFPHEMSRMRSGTEMSQFLRIFPI